MRLRHPSALFAQTRRARPHRPSNAAAAERIGPRRSRKRFARSISTSRACAPEGAEPASWRAQISSRANQDTLEPNDEARFCSPHRLVPTRLSSEGLFLRKCVADGASDADDAFDLVHSRRQQPGIRRRSVFVDAHAGSGSLAFAAAREGHDVYVLEQDPTLYDALWKTVQISGVGAHVHLWQNPLPGTALAEISEKAAVEPVAFLRTDLDAPLVRGISEFVRRHRPEMIVLHAGAQPEPLGSAPTNCSPPYALVAMNRLGYDVRALRAPAGVPALSAMRGLTYAEARAWLSRVPGARLVLEKSACAAARGGSEIADDLVPRSPAAACPFADDRDGGDELAGCLRGICNEPCRPYHPPVVRKMSANSTLPAGIGPAAF